MEKRSYWIWNYGEWEIYHTMKLSLRREDFGMDIPPFWKVHMPYGTARFVKEFSGQKGFLTAYGCGRGYVMVDGERYRLGEQVLLESGGHSVVAVIANPGGLPALYIKSGVCPSGPDWSADHYAGGLTPVGWEEAYDSLEKSPEQFLFSYARRVPVRMEPLEKGRLFDFGREVFGYLNIQQMVPEEELGVYYGESREEALDTAYSLLRETAVGKDAYRLRQRAFRYVYLEAGLTGGQWEKLAVTMDHEYLPFKKRGSFVCDRELYNRIYEVCEYTFQQNCRECFLDGIKRDRWVWAGDAYQSARINQYLFADEAIVRRTAIGLVGKEPVEQHINGILDYSLLWLIGLYEYDMAYGNMAFLERIYPMARLMMEFCETRLNREGFLVGRDEDWTFIDWAEMDKTGAVCAEQMLLAAAYQAFGELQKRLGVSEGEYQEKAAVLKERIQQFFWRGELGAYIDSYESGKEHVSRHANIFAVMYDIASPGQQAEILEHVLKNDGIAKIRTPYFQGYELDALGKLGEFGLLEERLDSYWGGMLALGAATVWEEFDPDKSGIEHYGMYGHKYEKSLCHAWGAGPIYLFGRYYLGVYPASAGYETFRVEPNPGGLARLSGTVPIREGEVHVDWENGTLRVLATRAGGSLMWKGKTYALQPGKELVI